MTSFWITNGTLLICLIIFFIWWSLVLIAVYNQLESRWCQWIPIISFFAPIIILYCQIRFYIKYMFKNNFLPWAKMYPIVRYFLILITASCKMVLEMWIYEYCEFIDNIAWKVTTYRILFSKITIIPLAPYFFSLYFQNVHKRK